LVLGASVWSTFSRPCSFAGRLACQSLESRPALDRQPGAVQARYDSTGPLAESSHRAISRDAHSERSDASYARIHLGLVPGSTYRDPGFACVLVADTAVVRTPLMRIALLECAYESPMPFRKEAPPI
jgi:hypothetical protein